MNNADGAVIRAYSDATDRDRLADIWLAASRIGHPFLSEAELLADQKMVREIYLPQAENRVIERDGLAVGFIGLIGNFIGGLFVDPAAQGGGFGRALVADAARRKGTLDVEVYDANAGAIAFYRRLGFVEVERRQHDDAGRPFAVVRMTRPA